MESLTNSFGGLKISTSTLHIFVNTKCNIPMKQAQFYPIEHKSPEKIEDSIQMGG
jgi:hypothetical protein